MTDRSMLAVLAEALLAGDLPDRTEDERRRGAEFAAARVARMPDSTRWAVRLTTAAAYAALSVAGGRALRQQPGPIRVRRTRWLLRQPLPGITELAKLIRGLALVGALEPADGDEAGR